MTSLQSLFGWHGANVIEDYMTQGFRWHQIVDAVACSDRKCAVLCRKDSGGVIDTGYVVWDNAVDVVMREQEES